MSNKDQIYSQPPNQPILVQHDQLGGGPVKEIHMSTFLDEASRQLHHQAAFGHTQHIIDRPERATFNSELAVVLSGFSELVILGQFEFPDKIRIYFFLRFLGWSKSNYEHLQPIKFLEEFSRTITSFKTQIQI